MLMTSNFCNNKYPQVRMGAPIFLTLLVLFVTLVKISDTNNSMINIVMDNSDQQGPLSNLDAVKELDLEPLKLLRQPKYLAAMVQENQDIISSLPSSGFLPDYKNFCWRDGESVFRCTPAIYLAGFIKCGTTDLYSKLTWHEDLLKPPAGKENMYWPRTRLGRRAGLYTKKPRPKETFETYTTRLRSICAKI